MNKRILAVSVSPESTQTIADHKIKLLNENVEGSYIVLFVNEVNTFLSEIYSEEEFNRNFFFLDPEIPSAFCRVLYRW